MAVGAVNMATPWEETYMKPMTAAVDFHAFVRRLKGLPEGEHMIDHQTRQFGDGSTYGNGIGDGNGRMDFAYFQQTLEYGYGEDFTAEYSDEGLIK